MPTDIKQNMINVVISFRLRTEKHQSKHNKNSASLAFCEGWPGLWKACECHDANMKYMYLITAQHTTQVDKLHSYQYASSLTHPLDKMAAISQMIFSDAFSWIWNVVFWLKFHWSLFLRAQLTVTRHCWSDSMTQLWGTRKRWVSQYGAISGDFVDLFS